VRPTAIEARADIANAHLVSTAIAARAEAPERQRFAIQPAYRVEGGFALRRLFIRRQALVKRPRLLDFLRLAAMVGFLDGEWRVANREMESAAIAIRHSPFAHGRILAMQAHPSCSMP